MVLTEKDLDGLPAELLNQLKLNKNNSILKTLKAVLIEAGEPITIDEAIVRVWQKTGRIVKRATMCTTLTRGKSIGIFIKTGKQTYTVATNESSGE